MISVNLIKQGCGLSILRAHGFTFCRTCFHIRRHVKHGSNSGGGNNGLGNSSTSTTIPTLPSTYSVHDFHSYGFHGTGVIPGLHFHLAASINAETGT